MKNKLMAKHCEKREENRERERKGGGRERERREDPGTCENSSYPIYCIHIVY